MIRVLMVMTDYTSVGHYRIGWPGKYMIDRVNGEVEVVLVSSVDFDPWDLGFIRGFDILHYNRLYGYVESTDELFDKIRQFGVRIVQDVDDHWEMPDEFEIKGIMKDNGDQYKELVQMGKVDAVTTTTDIFAREIGEINRNVFVIPNGIDMSHRMWQGEDIDSEYVRIGWLGSIMRHWDLMRMKDSIDRLYLDPELRGKFRFVQVGGESRDNDIFKGPEFVYHVGVPAWEFGKYYRELDICLGPMKENIYNRCKSEIKMVEAGMNGKPFVCQDFGIYSSHIENGVNGFLIGKDDDWYTPLRELILDRDRRIGMGKKLQEYCQQFSIDRVCAIRKEVYKQIMEL